MSKEIGKVLKDFYLKHVLKVRTAEERKADEERLTKKMIEVEAALLLLGEITKTIQEVRGDTEGAASTAKKMEKVREDIIELGANPEVELLDRMEKLVEDQKNKS